LEREREGGGGGEGRRGARKGIRMLDREKMSGKYRKRGGRNMDHMEREWRGIGIKLRNL